jgi:flavin-dependent dehydrogenase
MTFEAIVIGSGPGGCAAAITLADRGRHTLLIGDLAARRNWSGESLPPGAADLVAAIFDDRVLDIAVHRPAHGVRAAWGSEELVATEFIAHPDGDGWHVDRAMFDARLAAAAGARGVDVVTARVSSATHDGAHWRVVLDDGVATAPWLVDATGRGGGPLRAVAGRRHVHDAQVALVALASDLPSAPALTTVESAPAGWWYSTPLPDGRMVICLVTDHDLVPRGRGPRTGWWQEQIHLTRHIQRHDAQLGDAPTLHAAATVHRDALWGDGWAMAGDAAIAWDPLSSQGMVTAILMGSRLGDAINRRLAGDDHALPDWERDYLMLLDEHLGLRAYYWALEHRWGGHLFWDRRRAVSAT